MFNIYLKIKSHYLNIEFKAQIKSQDELLSIINLKKKLH